MQFLARRLLTWSLLVYRLHYMEVARSSKAKNGWQRSGSEIKNNKNRVCCRIVVRKVEGYLSHTGIYSTLNFVLTNSYKWILGSIYTRMYLFSVIYNKVSRSYSANNSLFQIISFTFLITIDEMSKHQRVHIILIKIMIVVHQLQQKWRYT